MIARPLWRLIAAVRSFVSRRKRLGAFGQRILYRVPALQDALFALARGDPEERYRRWIIAYDSIGDADLEAIEKELSVSADPPLLSLLVPVAQTDRAILEALASSLKAQVYGRWELSFVGDPPLDEGVTAFLAEAPALDSRFRPVAGRTVPLPAAWNAALRSARGEFAVLVDPHVLLRPHSLFLFARTIERSPDAILVYADDDAIDESGARSDHYFKPEWNEALFSCQNYFGGLVAFRRSLGMAVGGCQEELDGDFVWGLFLRLTADAARGTIHHLPFVLSHRRARQAAARTCDDAERGRIAQALEQRVARLGRRVQVEPVGESSYRTRFALPQRPPSVSVIVPSTCNLELLAPCLEGVFNRTSYPDLDVLLVVSEIRKRVGEQQAFLDAVASRPDVQVLFHEDRPYNFPSVNNWAAEQARGALICFLNDDTTVTSSDWLSAMVAQLCQDRVAAVGAMLLYPNDRIQHAGVVLGVGGIAGHAYRGRPRGIRGYHDRALVDQDVSCVTAACMLLRRDVFLGIGGFDEALAVAFNDVDLCLRLRKAGWRIVWTPSAQLYHRESASIGPHEAGEREEEWAIASRLMQTRWGDELGSDPHYNPNLSLDALQLWQPAFPPRVAYPWSSSDAAGRAALDKGLNGQETRRVAREGSSRMNESRRQHSTEEGDSWVETRHRRLKGVAGCADAAAS